MSTVRYIIFGSIFAVHRAPLYESEPQAIIHDHETEVSWKNFITDMAQRTAYGPVWKPQALEILYLIHLCGCENSHFS